MRHLWSLLAGLVAAPLAWLFLATGQHRSQQTVADWHAAGVFDTSALIGPAVFLAAAGVLLGLLGTLRWSPFGPLAAGLLLITPTIFLFNNPFRTLDAFSAGTDRRLFGQDLQPWLPVENGTLLVLGALLLMAVFSAQRWRRWPGDDSVGAAAGGTTAGGITAGGTTAGGTTDVGPAAGAAPAETPPESPPTEYLPMTDDEILAAAQEMERDTAAPADTEASAPDEPPDEQQPDPPRSR